MKSPTRKLLFLTAALLLVVAAAQPGFSQNITTGTLTGVVMDAQKGVLPGATVVAIHTPTGTTYEAVTQADGHFTMLAVRIGGPYTIKASMTGFKPAQQTDVQVALGEARFIELTLPLESVQETVTVTAQAQIIDTSRAGTAANIPTQTIETLPTISRSINDFARTSPFFNVTQDSANSDTPLVSVAGRNNRYNNMQIDGAVNNDVFGLASSGTPGGQTGTQPISLDAIQEIQLVVSPYDVRQGGFSGGGINAVTKSGTNAFHGTGYYFGRNQNLVGKIPAVQNLGGTATGDTKIGTFKDQQGGFSIGGPVVQNKAFFFTNIDFARKSTPAGYSADGSSGQQFESQAVVQQILDVAKNTYGFNPGGLSEFSKPQNSTKVFARGDFNLSSRNQLTARVNWVDGLANIGTQTNTGYNMPDHFYSIEDKMLSSVVQLNTSFGQAFNELRLTYQRERNVRGDQSDYSAFPEVTVYLPDGNQVSLGTEYSSQANKLNQDIVELTDDLTWVKGEHTFSVGTHNEFYKFYNLFIQNLYGSYYFNGVANFQKGVAGGYYHNFSNTADPNQAARFKVRQFGLYAGDKWRVLPNFTLTYGLRVDFPRFPDTPHANQVAVTDFGYRTDLVPAPTMWSPRVGFNWDLSQGSTRQRQIRGGFGLFTGRTPYVWLSNQYGNTGVDFTSLSVTYKATNSIPFYANPFSQPVTVTGGTTGKQTINVIDPNYKYPEIIRGNLALDHDLGVWGLIGTAEVLFSKNIKDIYYQNLNYVSTGHPLTALDGRLLDAKYDSNLNDVMLLTNTNKGYAWTMSFKVEKPFSKGFYASASYLYGRARSVIDGTSSVAASNWANNPTGYDTNNPPETVSNYDPGHRVNITATIPIPVWKLKSSASFFYNGMSGRPYDQRFNGDINGDGRTNNDLIFVPSSADQVIVQNGTWAQLDAFLSNDPAASKYRGQLMPRNAGRAPWSNQLDFRYALSVPTPHKTKADVTFDIFNLMNLLNKNWGWQYWAPFPSNRGLIGYGGIDSATGKVKYNLSTITASSFTGTFIRDDLRSRWQAQFGVRFRF